MQSAMHALNPVVTIGAQLTDVLQAHKLKMDRTDRRERAAFLLEMVGISADNLRRYPHQLSGGMRQRVMIAMALALEPAVVIMDEPTTALDVVTQREILTELAALQRDLSFAVLFITHDLSLLVELADSIAVMYAGRLLEQAAAGRPLPGAAAPVHARAAALVPAAARRADAADRDPGITAGSAHPAAGLPVPPPLRLRHGRLPDGDAGRVPARPGRRALGGLLAARRDSRGPRRTGRPRARLPLPRRGDRGPDLGGGRDRDRRPATGTEPGPGRTPWPGPSPRHRRSRRPRRPPRGSLRRRPSAGRSRRGTGRDGTRP